MNPDYASSPQSRRNPLRNVTSAHVMAALALIIAMSGTAFAAIGSTGIQDNSIRSRDVRNNSLQGIDVRNGTLGLTDLSSAARTGLGSRLYHYDTPTSVNAISGTPTQIASLQQLEPGDYLVHATTSAFSASLTNTADCSFTAGGTSFGGSFTHIAIDNRYYHLADTAVVSLNATGDISYMCTFLTGNATAAKRQIMALKINSAVELL